MKKILLFILISFSAFSQKAVYNNIKEPGNYTEYQTKEGSVLKIGDTIQINFPLGQEFTFLTQGDYHCGAQLSNTKAVVTKLKSIGNKTRGYKIYAAFKGYGMPVYIQYEEALQSGEIKY